MFWYPKVKITPPLLVAMCIQLVHDTKSTTPSPQDLFFLSHNKSLWKGPWNSSHNYVSLWVCSPCV